MELLWGILFYDKRHYGIDLWEELESYGVCVSDTRRHLVF